MRKLELKKLLKRKQMMTFVEIVIAMGLASVLLTATAYFYRQVVWIKAESDKLAARNFEKKYVESRLAMILPKIITPKKGEENFFFTTYEPQNVFKNGCPSLVFLFDAGIGSDRLFSNEVLARLYLDRQERLCLAYFPSPSRFEEGKMPPMKKEVLMENVDSIAFRFFAAPKKDRSKVLEYLNTSYKQEDPVALQEQEGKENKESKDKQPEKEKTEGEEENAALKENEQPDSKKEKENGFYSSSCSEFADEWNKEDHIPSLMRIDVYEKKGNEKVKTTYAFPLTRSTDVIVYE